MPCLPSSGHGISQRCRVSQLGRSRQVRRQAVKLSTTPAPQPEDYQRARVGTDLWDKACRILPAGCAPKPAVAPARLYNPAWAADSTRAGQPPAASHTQHSNVKPTRGLRNDAHARTAASFCGAAQVGRRRVRCCTRSRPRRKCWRPQGRATAACGAGCGGRCKDQSRCSAAIRAPPLPEAASGRRKAPRSAAPTAASVAAPPTKHQVTHTLKSLESARRDKVRNQHMPRAPRTWRPFARNRWRSASTVRLVQCGP